MSDDPRHELDADALAMLDAFRADEQLPPAVHDRVWERVAGDVEHERRARWLRRGVGLGVLAAAAVALLWVGGRALPSTRASDPASQAGYEQVDADGSKGRAQEHRPRERAEGERAVEPPPSPQPPQPPDAATPGAVEPAEPSAATTPADETSPSPRRARMPHPPSPRARPDEPTPTIQPGDDLAEENRLLGQARRALIDERPERALTRLAEHERRFPRGVLTEERQALRAVALCEADRPTEGRAAAQVFLREHPQAALAHRVRSACLD